MLSMRDQIDCDITLYVYSTIQFIEKAISELEDKAKILVHCYKVNNLNFKATFQGNSRSAVIVAGYYMWKYQMNENQAIEFVRKKRGFIDPNIGFIGQLMDFNKRLLIKRQSNENKSQLENGMCGLHKHKLPFMKNVI